MYSFVVEFPMSDFRVLCLCRLKFQMCFLFVFEAFKVIFLLRYSGIFFTVFPYV